MAYLNQDQLNQPGTSGQIADQGSGAYLGGSGGAGAVTKVAGAPTSSGFTNLNAYLDANKGQGTAMGGALANSVGQAGNTANTDINNWQANGVANAQGGTANVDQSKLNSIGQGLDDAGHYTGPNSIDATYSGLTDPNAVTGASQAQGATKVVDDQLHALGQGQPGISSMLKNVYNQPNYTQGENTLDGFLTGGGQGGQAALAGINKQWSGIDGVLGTASSAIGNAESQGQATSNATGQRYGDFIAGQKAKAAAYVAPVAPAAAPTPVTPPTQAPSTLTPQAPLSQAPTHNNIGDAGTPIIIPNNPVQQGLNPHNSQAGSPIIAPNPVAGAINRGGGWASKTYKRWNF